jgi:hypothetical protein
LKVYSFPFPFLFQTEVLLKMYVQVVEQQKKVEEVSFQWHYKTLTTLVFVASYKFNGKFIYLLYEVSNAKVRPQ